ncbi:MAG: CbiX/SirB N-terminal domain-containing protein [Candidatus Omnitrophica bacterium]|nr:CbiX/SirB N-terminal domain-containing protein [Candidatus Omnitrophota bacterium]
MIISHGSRFAKTKDEVCLLAKKLKELNPNFLVRPAFLELEYPDIPTGIQECVEEGADEVIVLMNFLNSGRHVDVDIPEIIRQCRMRYPDVAMRISQPVGQHPEIYQLFQDLIHKT